MTHLLRISLLAVAALLLAGGAAAQAQTNTTHTNITTTFTTNGSTIITTTTTVVTSTTVQTNTATAGTTAATPSTAKAAKAQPALAKNTNGWQTVVAVGVTLARGNTDTSQASLSAKTERKWDKNDMIFEADGLYGESRLPDEAKEMETAEILHGFAQYNRFFDTGFYWYGRVEGFHDGIADIKYRLTLAPGLGYYFFTNKITDLSAEIGPGYIKEQLDDHSESFATLRVAQQFHYAISPHAKTWETIEFLPQVDHFNNYIINFETGIEAGLTKSNRLSLRLVLRDSFDNVPAAGRLKNDLWIISALAYKF